MSKKKSHDIFLKEIFDLVNNEYEVLDNYIDSKSKIQFKHVNCNNLFFMDPDHFLRGQRCPECVGKNIKKTTERFKREVFDLVGNEYEVLGAYINIKTKICFKHLICNYDFDMEPNSFLHGGCRCPKCQKFIGISKITFSYNNVKEYIESIDGYILSSKEYINGKTKLDIKCPDGHFFNMDFEHFKRGERCPQCKNINTSIRCRKNINDIINEVEQYGFKIIEWVEEYQNRNSRFILECKNGHQNEVSVASFLNHHGCRSCHRSKGEEKIEEYLQNNNIEYKPQYTFDNCKNVKLLPFDFALLDSGILLFLIEFDGNHHYMPIDNYGGKSQFEKVKYRDKIKTNYCLTNNIPLLRIPYWEFDNIPQILETELSKYNLLGGDYNNLNEVMVI